MSSSKFYNIALLFILYFASSPINMAAANVLCPGQLSENFCDCGGDCTANPDFCACDEAKACCEEATPIVFCPGQNKENYCDCSGDCTEQPEWCQCEDAQECCDKAMSLDSISTEKILGVGGFGTILCPGQSKENYCDCSGDCTEQPEWCQCKDAQECCDKAMSLDSISTEPIFGVGGFGTILCPGQSKEDYCDCSGDCTKQPEWCQCDEAKKCCEGKTRPRVLLGMVVGVLTFACFLTSFLCYRMNKKSNCQESSLSEASQNAMSYPEFLSKSNDHVTVASADSHD